MWLVESGPKPWLETDLQAVIIKTQVTAKQSARQRGGLRGADGGKQRQDMKLGFAFVAGDL